MLQGKRFGSNKEMISETDAYFEAKDKSFYKKRHRIVRGVLKSVESMLMNKVKFCLEVVLLVRPGTY